MSTTSNSQLSRAFLSSSPVAPGNGAAIVLFATHPYSTTPASALVRGGKRVQVDPAFIEEVNLVFHKNNQASAANGLRAYALLPDGTWAETDMKGMVNAVADQPTIGAAAPIQVPALSSGQEWAERFIIGNYLGFALTYTAGATGPTSWSVSGSVLYSEQVG